MTGLAMGEATGPVAKGWARWDEWLASAAIALMVLIPIIELALRPLMGHGIMNAPVLVQHLGLVMAMFGALAAERHGHLTTLGGRPDPLDKSGRRRVLQALAWGGAACIGGRLTVPNAAPV